MATINLLPWREAARQRKNRHFKQLVGSMVLLAIAIICAIWFYLYSIHQSQQHANAKIKALIAQLDVLLEEKEAIDSRRQAIMTSMKTIQTLQSSRPIPVRIWNDVVTAVPAQLYLTSFKRENDVITFGGKADNANVVSIFVKNLDNIASLEKTQLKTISQTETVQQSVNHAVNTTAANSSLTTSNHLKTTNNINSHYLLPQDLDFIVTTHVTQHQVEHSQYEVVD